MTVRSIMAICVALVSLLCAANITLALAINKPPVAYWPFERCEDNTHVLDAMRHKHDGQLFGATVVDAGYQGRALSLDGVDDVVVIDNSEALFTGKTWSIAYWFRRFPQAPGGNSMLRNMIAVGDAEDFSISAVRGDKDQIYIRINESQKAFDFPFDLGWHHLVAVRDSDTVYLYVDGKQLGSLPGDVVRSQPLRLGHDGTDAHPVRHFNGLLDEVKVYDYALTPEQVASMIELNPPTVSVPFISGDFGGDLGYAYFRIPAVVTATDGSVLAFSEGRLNSGADYGNIDLVMRRSTDGGKTWGSLQVVWDDGTNTCGNPTPVVDRDTGRVWMIACHSLEKDTQTVLQAGKAESRRTVWTMYSDDHGVTWSKPVEITDAVTKPQWLWFATGPGVGIQTTDGRIVIPATRNEGSDNGRSSRSLVFYSDDHGQTWQLGGEAGDRVSEAQVVELSDDRLMLNMRRVGSRKMLLCQSYSNDLGDTWSPVTQQPQLISPGGQAVGYSGGCQASILRYTRADQQDRDRLILSNPANIYPYGAEGRINMTIRLSYDEGFSWAFERHLHPRWSAYSCLTVLDDHTIGLLYSWGDTKRYQRMLFERINLAWLTSGLEQTPQTPLPPKAIHAQAESAGKVKISWTNVENATGWRIYRYIDGSKGTADCIAELPANQTQYIDNSAPQDNAVYYRAEPFNEHGRPPFTSVAKIHSR